MRAVVVDANVALKWVLAEEYRAEARALLSEVIRQHEVILAPPLLPSEVTNALFQNVRRGRITAAEATNALNDFLTFPVVLMAPPDLYPQTLAFAATHGLTKTYDALYVVLAQLLGTELWTADQHLINSVGAAAPWIRFIGDFPIP